jgi:probable addiction module antidote protein
MKGKPFDDVVVELLCDDPDLAADMLNSVLEDGDQSELLTTLRRMAKAFGGVPKVAEQAHLNPTQLYRTLSPNGNPAVSSLAAILKVMGLRLAVQPIKSSHV